MEPATSPCVCTNLRMATRMVGRIYDRALAPTGLRATGLAILARLDQEGSLTVGELAGRLVLEPSSCSREVALLVKGGLVNSRPGSDRRHRDLSITRSGRGRLAEARRLRDEAQHDLRTVYGEGATDDLLEALRRIVEVGIELEEPEAS